MRQQAGQEGGQLRTLPFHNTADPGDRRGVFNIQNRCWTLHSRLTGPLMAWHPRGKPGIPIYLVAHCPYRTSRP